MTRTNLINYIIKKQGYETYLEIGIGTGNNFKAVECEKKWGIDPEINSIQGVINKTSDWFFDIRHKGKAENKYDIIFIDGLHHADQVRRDIINSWKCLTDGGCLVIHDTNPDREEITHVPRDSKEWCGDVYKAVFQVKNDKFTLADDHGVTVIFKTSPLVMNDEVVNWEEFDMFREEILNLKTWDECVKIIDSIKVLS